MAAQLEKLLEQLRPREGKRVDLGLEGYEAYIVSDKYNPLAKRREVELVLLHVGKPTPPRWDLRGAVANALGVDVKRTWIRNIKTEYGLGRSRVEVHIYDTLERALYFEQKHVICRNLLPDEWEAPEFKDVVQRYCMKKR